MLTEVLLVSIVLQVIRFELTAAHTFENGESIRIISEDGSLPDGLDLK